MKKEEKSNKPTQESTYITTPIRSRKKSKKTDTKEEIKISKKLDFDNSNEVIQIDNSDEDDIKIQKVVKKEEKEEFKKVKTPIKSRKSLRKSVSFDLEKNETKLIQ